jgi:hypothetical protein
VPSFGKIHIGYGWIAMKTLLISLTTVLLFTPLIVIAVPILIYEYYLIIHEFIHAAAIAKYGGILESLYLGYPRSFIDARMPSVESERAVFGWGAFADLMVMLMITYSLYLWSDLIAMIFLTVFVLGEFLPEHSDFREYSKRKV